MGFQWGEKPGFLYGTGFLDDKKWQQLFKYNKLFWIRFNPEKL
tara:strand:- start:320 stop:448 length:129 start_codon:yes stop_codon:yes gene_type:complete